MGLIVAELPTPRISYAGGSVVHPVRVIEDPAIAFACTLCVVPIVGIGVDCGPADMLCMDCGVAVRDAMNIYFYKPGSGSVLEGVQAVEDIAKDFSDAPQSDPAPIVEEDSLTETPEDEPTSEEPESPRPAKGRPKRR